MSDILHRYICEKCKKNVLDFSEPAAACCGKWLLADSASTVATTTGIFGSQYDSIDTINQDVDEYREKDEENRAWKEIEQSRRQ